ncbi:MAG: rhomboid family intramembrane serine protease [Ktedonobacteraceae bacterium]|nr:rhomboid family intramembrane serine protease [Ktedonobacteraceae bacterium]
MEAQTDIQTYLEQGKQALAQGQRREAAIAYAHGAQIEPENPMIHLGLAEANLALGNYNVVRMASQRVQELQPQGGVESMTAQALLDLLDHRYDRALQTVDTIIKQNPGIAYVHAMRSYLLRTLGQDYDANLARARAARLSYGGRFENCFPPVEEQRYAAGYQPIPDLPPAANQPEETQARPSQLEREPVPAWSRPNGLQRQMVRTRFVLSQYPGIVTNILIIINIIVYLFTAIVGHNLLEISTDVIATYGGQNTLLIQQTGEYWRILTAMFLHFNLWHIALNMFSLYLIGRVVEVFYGRWRYLLIYLLSGIAGGIVTYFFQAPNTLSAGASGAIFGVFGAMGAFYIVNRRALGAYGRGMVSQWIFVLAINVALNLSLAGLSITDHLGGLIAGIILGFLLIARLERRFPI